MSTPEPSTGLRLDAAAVRVLAHPLRSRLLSQLRLDGADPGQIPFEPYLERSKHYRGLFA